MTPQTTITLPLHIHAAIIAHALEGAPEEVCGILSGRDGLATELVRGRNEAQNRMIAYWMDAQTLLKQFDFADRGEELIAIYHSHPAGAAYPSATDARDAFYPDATYLICSLEHPERPVLAAFRLYAQDLAERPVGAQPVRHNPHFLARRQRRNAYDYYDLIVIEANGRELWQRVHVVEQEILVVP
jgi:proteasome lid subunit RPN8/RPN11